MLGLFRSITKQSDDQRAREYREIIRKEAELGGTLFGPVPEGVRREFFCLDRRTWVWHEEWTDAQGKRHVVTTRYDIRPNGILKAQDGQPYRYLEREEASRFFKAVMMYNRTVHQQVYKI